MFPKGLNPELSCLNLFHETQLFSLSSLFSFFLPFLLLPFAAYFFFETKKTHLFCQGGGHLVLQDAGIAMRSEPATALLCNLRLRRWRRRWRWARVLPERAQQPRAVVRQQAGQVKHRAIKQVFLLRIEPLGQQKRNLSHT